MFHDNTFDNTQAPCSHTMGFGKKLLFLMIGGGIGAGLALLFAPKPGKELREDIAAEAARRYEETLEAANRAKEHAGEYYIAAREKGAEALEAMAGKVAVVKGEVLEDVVKIGEIVEKGAKRAADTVRSAHVA